MSTDWAILRFRLDRTKAALLLRKLHDPKISNKRTLLHVSCKPYCNVTSNCRNKD